MNTRFPPWSKAFFTCLLSFSLLGLSDVQLGDIETAMIQKDYAKAQGLAREFISRFPSGAKADEARYYLGLSQLRLGQYAAAREVLKGLSRSRQDPKLSDKIVLGIVDSFYMEGHYPEALAEAEALLKKSPNSESLSLIYLKLARSNLKLANWEKARVYLSTIVEHFPESLEFHVARQLLEEKRFFAVQVGAFLDNKLAGQLTDELKGRGEYAYIVETQDRKGQKFYRVRVGQFADLKDAEGLRIRLAQTGYPTQIYP